MYIARLARHDISPPSITAALINAIVRVNQWWQIVWRGSFSPTFETEASITK